ncbi:MAG: tetratricopeptide repeat protein, partial [Myxococcaceae bacterium]|nr:tetratricopeptide repeat protein [Myxococcaceae bacterium]
GGVAVFPWLGSRREAAQCAQAAQVAAVLQGPELLGAVERKLAAELGAAEPGPVRELRASVGGFVSRWAAVRASACFGATPQARATEAARVACLGRKLDQVTALLTLLKDTSRPIAGSAVKALGGVSSLEDCTLDAAALPAVEAPVDPALTRALDALTATFELGDYAEAQRLGHALEPLARAQPSKRFLAESLVPIARSRNAMGDNEAARALMFEAFEVSEADGLKANAALALLYVGAITGLDLHRPEEGLALIRVTEVNARRDRLGEELSARLAEIRGRVLGGAGRFEEGAAALTDALARYRALPTAPAFALAKTMSELASAQHEAGRRAASLELFSESIARLTELGGSRHPQVAVAQTNQANVLASLGRDREALESYQKALTTQRERLGDKACNTLDTRASLSLVQARLVDPVAALQEARDAVAAEENAQCPSAYFESALWHLAEVARLAGQSDLSAATAQRLLERITADPSLGAFEFDPELQLARVESARGHHTEALRLAARQCEATAAHVPRGHPARIECELARVRLRTAASDPSLATDPLLDALAGDDRELCPEDVALRASLRTARQKTP